MAVVVLSVGVSPSSQWGRQTTIVNNFFFKYIYSFQQQRQSHLPLWWLVWDIFSHHTNLLNMFKMSIRCTKEIMFSSETTISTHLTEQLLFGITQIGSCWENLSCNFPCCNLSLLNHFGCAAKGSVICRRIGPTNTNICPRPCVFGRERRLQLFIGNTSKRWVAVCLTYFPACRKSKAIKKALQLLIVLFNEMQVIWNWRPQTPNDFSCPLTGQNLALLLSPLLFL